MADVGPPIALIAVGAILWLAITATIGGISIQTIGLILTIIGVVWLVIELVINGRRRTTTTTHLRPANAWSSDRSRVSARCSSGTRDQRGDATSEAVWTHVQAASSPS